MLRSPGTKRRIAFSVPEEVELKLALLGVRLEWRPEFMAWQVIWSSGGKFIERLIDPYFTEWDSLLEDLADLITKLRYPIGWTNTQRVDTMAIEAASVIAEDFDEPKT